MPSTLTLPRCQAWGYPTEEAYYRDASSSDALLNIRIPFLAVQAKDDPVRPCIAPSSSVMPHH